ncbi:MAG TPA: MOSC domain-containing protein [Pyrinomonadaceae bacterium]|jgi:MOSC domain-containing protein YiiM
MRLVSVNVGRPRLAEWRGRLVSTGIFKEPVAGRVMLRRLNLDGDRQADLTVHGGRDKAVYAYPSEHYPRWRAELPHPQLAYGGFGENFTTEGLDETTVNVGDEFRVGSARVVATQPRQPCFKLGLRFGRADMVRLFHESRRSGFYLAVLEEGEVGAGDAFELVRRDEHNVAVADLYGLFSGDAASPDLLRRALDVEALPEGWRSALRELLEEIG